MNSKRTALVSVTLALSILFMIMMNVKYDSLSRYQYKVPEDIAEEIKEKLNGDEINYIIDYSIDYREFYGFLHAPSFNIYHIEDYNRFRNALYYLTENEVVEYVESIEEYDLDKALLLINNGYDYLDVRNYFKNGDDYVKDALIEEDPADLKVELRDDETVYCYEVTDLTPVDFMKTSKEIYLRRIARVPLLSLIDDVNQHFESTNFVNTTMKEGYIDYHTLKQAYDSGESDLVPGHTYYQLGLTIDLDNETRYSKEVFEYIDSVIGNYGFIIVDPMEHIYRYTG